MMMQTVAIGGLVVAVIKLMQPEETNRPKTYQT
jgi:hypothetical protein